MQSKDTKPAFDEFIEVHVRSRKPNENVVDYVKEVAREVGIHHSHRGCNYGACDLMLPDNPNGVGF